MLNILNDTMQILIILKGLKFGEKQELNFKTFNTVFHFPFLFNSTLHIFIFSFICLSYFLLLSLPY